jgi:hypothetical protein
LNTELLRLVLKELYLHGFIVSAGAEHDDKYESDLPPGRSLIEVKFFCSRETLISSYLYSFFQHVFRFTKTFQRSITDKSLGVLYYLILFDEEYLSENLRLDFNEKFSPSLIDNFWEKDNDLCFEDDRARSFHLSLFAVMDQLYYFGQTFTSIVTPLEIGDDNHQISCSISIYEKEKTHIFFSGPSIFPDDVRNKKPVVVLKSLLASMSDQIQPKSSVSAPCAETEDEISDELISSTEVSISFANEDLSSSSFLRFKDKLSDYDLFIQTMKSNGYDEVGDLPWKDYAGNYNFKSFKIYSGHVLAFISEYPASSMTSIHSNLMFLSKKHVIMLLDTLCKMRIIHTHHPFDSIILSNPFESLSFWTKDSFFSPSSEVYYEISIHN